MTLHELREKINSRYIFFSAVVVLVGFASFGLGRLSLLESKREPVRVENALTQTAAVAITTTPPPRGLGTSPYQGEEEKMTLGGQIVASKTGAKYHFPWCAGAAQIAEKNKIWFASTEEARKAGYTPASNCKGLK